MILFYNKKNKPKNFKNRLKNYILNRVSIESILKEILNFNTDCLNIRYSIHIFLKFQ